MRAAVEPFPEDYGPEGLAPDPEKPAGDNSPAEHDNWPVPVQEHLGLEEPLAEIGTNRSLGKVASPGPWGPPLVRGPGERHPRLVAGPWRLMSRGPNPE